MDLAPGQIKEKALRDGGFNDDEVAQWKSQTADTLTTSGFSAQETRDYFGQKTADMSDVGNIVSNNIAKTKQSADLATDKEKRQPVDASLRPVEAEDIWDALTAGYEQSSGGVYDTKNKPNMVLPENAGIGKQVASMIGHVGGDLPAMALGLVGGPIGAFSAPPAIRQALVDHYERGDIDSASEFANRAVSVAKEAAKGALTGLAMMSGGIVGAAIGRVGGAALSSATGGVISDGVAGSIGMVTGRAAGETAAMSTASAALEGRLPDKKDLMNAAVAVGGLHALSTVGSLSLQALKIGRIYATTGASPNEIAEAAASDPVLKTELLSKQENLPQEAINPNKEITPATEEAKPEPTPQSAARDRVLGLVGETKPNGEGVWQKLKDAPGDVYTNYVDYTNAIDSDKAQVKARLYAAVNDRVMEMITNGTRDFKSGAVNGEGYDTIINDAKKELGPDWRKKLNSFRISQATLGYAKEGITQLGDLDDHQSVVESEAEAKPFADRILAWRNKGLDYLQASGRYSKDVVDDWKSRPYYSPLKKIIETDELTGEGTKASGSIKSIGSVDKKAKMKLVDPIESDLKDMEMMIKLSDRTQAHNIYADDMMGKDNPDSVIRISDEQKGPLGDSQIAGYKDGVRTKYDVDPGVAEALSSMAGNAPVLNLWQTAMNKLAAGLRIGTIYNPMFAGRHIERQQLTAATLSKTGLAPYQSLLYAPEFFEKGNSYHDFIYDGGAINQLEPVKDFIQTKINDYKGSALGRAVNQLKDVAQFSHTAITINDNLIRFSEYKRTLEAGGTREEAAFAAREVLPDVQKTGLEKAAMQQFRQTAFLNVHVQGVARMGQEISENPWGYAAKNLAYITIPSILLHVANRNDDAVQDLPNWQKYNYWHIHPSDWRPANSLAEAMSVQQDYPSNVRQKPDGSYEVNDGPIFRLQKPFANGVFFGSLTEAALDSWKKGNAKPFEDFAGEVIKSLIVTPIPSGSVGGIQQAVNYNLYSGQPIVGHSMENKLPETQYNRYTSETSKAISRLLVEYVPPASALGPKNTKLGSPMVIDSWIKSLSGTMGPYAIDVLDQALAKAGIAPDNVKPYTDLTEKPFIKEWFVRQPMMTPQSVTDFEDRFSKADKAFNSYKQLMLEGDVHGAVKLNDKYQIIMGDRLQGANKAMQNLSSMISKTYALPMDAVEKRQLMDRMMYMRIHIAQEGNKLMDEIESASKGSK